MTTATVARFLTAVEEQSCTTHAPRAAAEIATLLAERSVAAAAGGLVAVADTAPLLPAPVLAAALAAAGIDVLGPDDPEWRARIPTATVGITAARIAVAELGVVAVESGPGRPRSVSLLPETHLCLVADTDVVDTLAEAMERVAAARLPSGLLWIGGPSRTGDLEMIVTLGVHGPRAVEIMVVDTAAAAP